MPFKKIIKIEREKKAYQVLFYQQLSSYVDMLVQMRERRPFGDIQENEKQAWTLDIPN